MPNDLPLPVSPDDSGPLDHIGKYQILAKIGQGAMGEVFKGHDPVLNRDLAIKTMSASVLADPELSKRFLREAQSAARLNHPNIVTLHEFGEDQGRVFMAMELLDGRDLSHLIKHRALASLEDKLGVMEQICDGLAYAHAMQVVHRDLKPANIHVAASGRVKIMDFGLARLGASDMTRAGTVMGSPNYMSPEQVRGERADARSDIFALGSVFYELLSGRRAFEADSMAAVLYKVTDAQPTPLGDVQADLPVIVVALVEKALAKLPNDRFQDAREMREALELCRRVVEGSLDEDAALASLREARTMMQPRADPDRDADPATLPAGAATLSAGSVAVPRRGTTTRLPTVRATRVSRVAEPAEPATAPPPSRTPVYVAGAVAVVALAVGLVTLGVLLKGPAAPPSPNGPDPQARALVAVAVESQLDAARKSLQYKDLRGAFDASEKVLRLDPGNAEALQIQRQAKTALDRVEGAVREAREAVQAGNLDKAAQALSLVLAEMPDHPVASQLSNQLNSRFREQADDALKASNRAAEDARKAGAGTLREYGQALAQQQQAEQLYGQRQYTTAAQKFMEARRGFEGAQRAAVQLSVKPVRTPTPTPQSSAANVPPASVSPAPVVTPTAPPTSAAASVPPAPTPPPANVENDESAARRVIAEFARAIQEKDIPLYKTLRPGLSVDEERRLREAFQNVKSQEVVFTIQSVELGDRQATVRATRTGRVNGEPVAVRQVFRLIKGPAGWVIREIGQ